MKFVFNSVRIVTIPDFCSIKYRGSKINEGLEYIKHFEHMLTLHYIVYLYVLLKGLIG